MSKSLKYIASAVMLTVQLVNDETEEVERTLTVEAAEVPDLLKNGDDEESLKLYGIRKVLQERSSSEKDPTVKFESRLETADILRRGLWKSDEARARVPQIDPVFAQAIANIKGATLGAAVAGLQALDKDRRDALRKNPAVIAEIEKLEAQAAGATAIDLDSIG